MYVYVEGEFYGDWDLNTHPAKFMNGISTVSKAFCLGDLVAYMQEHRQRIVIILTQMDIGILVYVKELVHCT